MGSGPKSELVPGTTASATSRSKSESVVWDSRQRKAILEGAALEQEKRSAERNYNT